MVCPYCWSTDTGFNYEGLGTPLCCNCGWTFSADAARHAAWCKYRTWAFVATVLLAAAILVLGCSSSSPSSPEGAPAMILPVTDMLGYVLFLIIGAVIGALVMRIIDVRNCDTCYVAHFNDQDEKCPCICHLTPGKTTCGDRT